MKTGRPTNYNKSFLPSGLKYVNEDYRKTELVPTVAGLAVYLSIPRQKVYVYAEKNEDFRDIVLEKLLATQEIRLVTGGLGGKFSAKIAALMLAKHGYKESWEVSSPDFIFDEET